MPDDLSFLRPQQDFELPNFPSKRRTKRGANKPGDLDIVQHKLTLSPHDDIEGALDLLAAFSGPMVDYYHLPADYNAFLFVIKSIRRQHPLVTVEAVIDADEQARLAALGRGLLFYASREADDEGRGMSACGWTSRKAAQDSLESREHRYAASLVDEMYTETTMSYYNVDVSRVDRTVKLNPIGEPRIQTY